MSDNYSGRSPGSASLCPASASVSGAASSLGVLASSPQAVMSAVVKMPRIQQGRGDRGEDIGVLERARRHAQRALMKLLREILRAVCIRALLWRGSVRARDEDSANRLFQLADASGPRITVADLIEAASNTIKDVRGGDRFFPPHCARGCARSAVGVPLGTVPSVGAAVASQSHPTTDGRRSPHASVLGRTAPQVGRWSRR
ncbi:MAG: hypothetical protein ACI81R_001656 [Bradymonadia bacterium]|jgi:hypothetical protein